MSTCGEVAVARRERSRRDALEEPLIAVVRSENSLGVSSRRKSTTVPLVSLAPLESHARERLVSAPLRSAVIPPMAPAAPAAPLMTPSRSPSGTLSGRSARAPETLSAKTSDGSGTTSESVTNETSSTTEAKPSIVARSPARSVLAFLGATASASSNG